MNDKEKTDILFKAIERIFSKNPEMQKLIDESVIDRCKEEGESPEKVFFLFLLSFAVVFIVMRYPNINFPCVNESCL